MNQYFKLILQDLKSVWEKKHTHTHLFSHSMLDRGKRPNNVFEGNSDKIIHLFPLVLEFFLAALLFSASDPLPLSLSCSLESSLLSPSSSCSPLSLPDSLSEKKISRCSLIYSHLIIHKDTSKCQHSSQMKPDAEFQFSGPQVFHISYFCPLVT